VCVLIRIAILMCLTRCQRQSGANAQTSITLLDIDDLDLFDAIVSYVLESQDSGYMVWTPLGNHCIQHFFVMSNAAMSKHMISFLTSSIAKIFSGFIFIRPCQF